MCSVFWRCFIPKADKTIIIRQRRQQQQQQLYPSSTTFDGLPSDVLGKIFGLLPIGDRARMRLVSKSWREFLVRSDFPVKPEPPWRILPIDSYDQPKYLSTEISFESMSEERTYRFQLRYGRYRWCCCGSSSDGGSWLLMAGRKAGDDLSSTMMILWDPISGTTRRLPALSTLPFFGELVDSCKRMGLGSISTSLVIARARVFSAGSVECVVAVVFTQSGDISHVRTKYPLALCSPQDQSWSAVPYDGPDENYADMLFHNGKLFTVWTVDTMVKTTVWSVPVVRKRGHCTVRLSCCDVEVTMWDLVYEDQDSLPVGSSSTQEIRLKLMEHLVASSAGELLVVCSISDVSPSMSGQVRTFKTKGFEVYRLDNKGGSCCLQRLRNVGRQCLFVGDVGSTSLTELAAAGGVDYGNTIHFATNDAQGLYDYFDEEEGIVNSEILIGHEQGVFDMVRDKIERTCLTNFSIQTGSCTGWFTPKLPTS